jgi:hypothetical protein
MQTEGEEETSSTAMMDPWSIFLYRMKAPMTREKYRGRLVKFLISLAWIQSKLRTNDKGRVVAIKREYIEFSIANLFCT